MIGARGISYIARFDRNTWALAVGWFVSGLGFSVSLPFVSIWPGP